MELNYNNTIMQPENPQVSGNLLLVNIGSKAKKKKSQQFRSILD